MSTKRGGPTLILLSLPLCPDGPTWPKLYIYQVGTKKSMRDSDLPGLSLLSLPLYICMYVFYIHVVQG